MIISTQPILAAEQIYLKKLERTDNCETFSLERGIVSLRWRQFFQNKRNGELDTTVITL